MTKEVRVVFVGDIALNEDRTPHGTKVSPGGAAYYSAVGASYFTPDVGVVAKIGQDFDPQIIKRRNIDTAGLHQVAGETCRFILTQHADNTRNFSAERGVAAKVDTSIFPDHYRNSPYIHLPTQLPEHALQWLTFLEGHGNVSVDPFEAFVKDYPELTRIMLERADFIFLNEEEYADLSSTTSALTDRPVVLKMGARGAMYMSPQETYTFPAPKVNALETTGAGDVLAGAFLAQLANGIIIPTALENAIHLASISVTQFGVEHISAQSEINMKDQPKLVSAALVLNENGEVFMGRCPKFNSAWIVPGGHIDEGESPSDAAVREVYEELGVKVHTPIFLKFHELFSPDYKNVGALFHCHNFAVIMKPDQEIKLNEEYDDYIFVSPDKALEKEDLHPSARMIIEYYLEYKNINNT